MRVLCIDGGGIRGLLPALVLAELERRCGRPVAALVDLVAGTSTGGLLACGLTLPGPDGRPRYSAAELAARYEEEGPRVFRRGLLKRVTSLDGLVDERYPSAALAASLRRSLGDAWLSGALVDVLVPAYDIERRAAFFFRSARARRDPAYDFPLAVAAQATAAAPTYFAPVVAQDRAGAGRYALIDGGVFAANPALSAAAEVSRTQPLEDVALLLSLGTGSAETPIRRADARGWGSFGWARPIVDVLLDGQADTTDFVAARLLPGRYVRLQTRLRDASPALDDASPANLAALRREATRLIAERSADLDAACAALTA